MEKIRYNVPKDLLDYELYENKKKEEMFGEESKYIVRIVEELDEVVEEKPKYNVSSNMNGVIEYAEYERNKLKKYK